MTDRIKRRSPESEQWREIICERMFRYQESRDKYPNFVIPSVFRVGWALRHRRTRITEQQAWKEYEANLPMEFFE